MDTLNKENTKDSIDWEEEKDVDKHLCCSAYPNCNIDPNGCCYSETGDIALYGHKG